MYNNLNKRMNRKKSLYVKYFKLGIQNHKLLHNLMSKQKNTYALKYKNNYVLQNYKKFNIILPNSLQLLVMPILYF